MKNEKPKLGIALGSGASRGLAHIGVIEALEEENIDIQFIAGSSMGAVIGAAYAAGSLNKVKNFLTTVDWRTMASYLDFNFPQQGLIEGEKIIKLIDYLIPRKSFEELDKPFCAIATDLTTGEEINLKKGNLIKAIRASISLPGIFNPYEINGSYVVDGGLVNPVPVDVVRDMGADVVLAVDLNNDLVSRNGRKKKLKARRKNKETIKDSSFLNRASNNNWLPPKLEEKYRNLEYSVKESVNRWLEDKEEEENRIPNIFDVIANSINIMEYHITQCKLLDDKPDILVQPKLGHLNLFDYNEAEATIQEGYQRTREKIRNFRESAEALGE